LSLLGFQQLQKVEPIPCVAIFASSFFTFAPTKPVLGSVWDFVNVSLEDEFGVLQPCHTAIAIQNPKAAAEDECLWHNLFASYQARVHDPVEVRYEANIGEADDLVMTDM
jgi:hypothetical protein